MNYNQLLFAGTYSWFGITNSNGRALIFNRGLGQNGAEQCQS